MAASCGSGNDVTFAQILATHYLGGGSLPHYLGLEPDHFARLLECHFPDIDVPNPVPRPAPEWDPRLVEEKDELIKLMVMYRAGTDASEITMSRIVATACMANDHLWQDLGLWSRKDLSALMVRNFPGLAAKNDHDMKWKKFLYKQLCIQEGIYICRAPSCAQCSDYQNCFGPEE
jgi:nitrogen fixation protein NifQ